MSQWEYPPFQSRPSASSGGASEPDTRDDESRHGSSRDKDEIYIWLNRVREIIARDGKAIFIISLTGIVLPFIIVSVIANILGVGGFLSPDIAYFHQLMRHGNEMLADLIIALVSVVVAGYIVSAGWIAAIWAMVQGDSGPASVSIVQAFRYGFIRAKSMLLWTLLVSFCVTAGLFLFFFPGIYIIFACCLYGYVVVFERGSHPLRRSLNLTHDRIGSSYVRIALCFIPYMVYSFLFNFIKSTTFKSFFDVGAITGTTTHLGSIILYNVMYIIQVALLTPAITVIVVGLFVTYVELSRPRAGLPRHDRPLATEGLRDLL